MVGYGRVCIKFYLLSFICCEDMMRTPALMKNLVSLSVPDPSLLSGLLGEFNPQKPT
jgi:hypothetical protein